MIQLASHPQWPHVLFVAQKLWQSGFEAYLAGGCVRDALLGVTPHDFDIATNATPDMVESLFERSIAVGKQFGVIIIPFEDFQIEVATFRRDVDYQDGRRPTSVEFSSPEEDAKRRDFTVNALFYDLKSQKILDFVGGQQDLGKRLIRAVGEPRLRFEEDKLRLLRAVRFQGQLDFAIESTTYQAVCEWSEQIHVVSPERIREEMTKLLKSKAVTKALLTLDEVGLLNTLFPTSRQKSWNTSFGKLQNKTPEALWSLFFADWAYSLDAKSIASSLAWLKFSAQSLKTITQVLSHLKILSTQSEWSRHELMRLFAENWAATLLDVFTAWSPNAQSAEWYRTQVQTCLGDDRALPAPLITGRDLQNLGLKPGPEFKTVLDHVYNAQLDGDIQTAEQAVAMIKKLKGL